LAFSILFQLFRSVSYEGFDGLFGKYFEQGLIVLDRNILFQGMQKHLLRQVAFILKGHLDFGA
jgi:hypothetical protein